MTVKTALKSAAPTPKVAAQTSVGVITGLITWLLVTTYWKTGLPVQVAVALPGLVTWGVGFAAGWLKKENIVVPPLEAKGPQALPVSDVHTAEWLADVRKPGPYGRSFWKPGEDVGLPIPALAAGNLMEDDVTTGEFTPGLAAYAGYSAGSFSNMTAVRKYAASQNARSFAFSGIASQLSGADAIDMEPGLASTSAAAGAYRQGIRYFYASASSVAAVNANLAGAGISRSSYKIISAHYSGEHICGPSTCGYPQADATQWTDTYLGRSLDCTVFNATFWGSTPPPPPPNPNPTIQLGSTGAAVTTAQTDLNKWHTIAGTNAAVTVDGSYGALTEAAVKSFQGAKKLTMDGVVGPATWAILKTTPVKPTPPPVGHYGAPLRPLAEQVASTSVEYEITWDAPHAVVGVPAPTEYQVFVYDGVPDEAHIIAPAFTVVVPKLTVTLKHGQHYIVHIVAAGDTKYIGADIFATLLITA